MYRYATLVAFGLIAGPAHAGDLFELQGESFDLGNFHGIVYYTSDDDGYRVVTTVAEGEAGPPLRFVATLKEGQSLMLSVPGKVGEPRKALEISRADRKLILAEEKMIPTALASSGK